MIYMKEISWLKMAQVRIGTFQNELILSWFWNRWIVTIPVCRKYRRSNDFHRLWQCCFWVQSLGYWISSHKMGKSKLLKLRWKPTINFVHELLDKDKPHFFGTILNTKFWKSIMGIDVFDTSFSKKRFKGAKSDLLVFGFSWELKSGIKNKLNWLNWQRVFSRRTFFCFEIFFKKIRFKGAKSDLLVLGFSRELK